MALHTLVMSDLHLTDAEFGRPGKALWKRYKRPRFFIDGTFTRCLKYLESEIPPTDHIELVLNGDIFDFDSVMRLPLHPTFPISWLERKRGLDSEEEKSRFKMQVILEDHKEWVTTLREFILRGHRVVFVIGNHDIEMHWPAVQGELLKALNLPEHDQNRVVFCEWFYISNHDTTIEHGNQYDDFCVASNPMHPLIRVGKKIWVRLPFGNITSRYMTNGMGLFNPHVEASFLMPFWEYFRFFYKYALRVQPWLPLSWLWSSSVSFWVGIRDGLLPALRDPLYVEQRTEEIATKANATPVMVRTLRELHTHPIIFNPIKMARELWLDRFLILLFFAFLAFEFYAILNLILPVPGFWALMFFTFLVPLLIYYSRNINSEIMNSTDEALKAAPYVSKITKTERVIFGHTHRELNTMVDQTHVLNTGTWSPAFRDPECRQSYGKKCFAWVRPKREGEGREASLWIWSDPGIEEIKMKR